MAPRVLNAALLCLPHPALDLGEGLLDRIEIGRAGRQKTQGGTGGLDGVAHGGGLMATEIVHDDDVAGLEGGHELLRDIGGEAAAVDGPVEDSRGGQAVATQGAEEGQRAPVAVRGEGSEPLAFPPPSAQRRHVGLDPGFVDEDEPGRIEAGLPDLPAPAPAGDVGTGLLKGEQRFF